MKLLSELAEDKNIEVEYEKAFWLRQFRKLCARMEKDYKFKNRIKQLLRETHEEIEAICLIILKETGKGSTR